MLTDSSLFSLLLCKNVTKLFDTLFSDTSAAGCKENYHRKLHQLPYLDMSRIIYILCKKHNWVEEDSYPIVDASTLKKDIECGDIIEECRKIIHPPDIFTKPRGKYSSFKQK